MKFTRDFYISAGERKVAVKGLPIVFYISEAGGAFYGKAFVGKAIKPTWNYRFKSAERRETVMKETIENYIGREKWKAEAKAKAKAAGRGVEIADILRASWGYDMTIVDYYEVTKLIGKTMVEIRPIADMKTGDGWTGKSAPEPGAYTGPAIRKVAKDGRVKIDTVSTAYKVEPEKEIAGMKIYAGAYYNTLD